MSYSGTQSGILRGIKIRKFNNRLSLKDSLRVHLDVGTNITTEIKLMEISNQCKIVDTFNKSLMLALPIESTPLQINYTFMQ